MRVVDAHVHIFPDEIVRNRERFLERDDWFRLLYESPRARLAAAADLIESMDASGVDVSVACGFPWRDPGLCRYHNDYMRESAQQHPDRIAWLAICSPTQVDDSLHVLSDAFDGGASGVGELNGDAQGFDLGDPEMTRVLAEFCIIHDTPAMFHVSEPVGHTYPGKGASTPDKLLRVLAAYPDLRVVAAHWGGGLPFYELMPEVRELTVNVCYDSAASTYLYDRRVFETAAMLAGPERILFASDFPVLKQGPLLSRVREREWATEDALAGVLGENAIRTYGLEGMFE
jgi:predicted TIM-barrel fold metal-dependent hydrolase